MNIAKMTSRMTVMKPIRAQDGLGGYKTTYEAQSTLWAELLRPRFNSANIQGDAGAVVITQGIRIRRTNAVNRGDKVSVAGRMYNVLHVDDSVTGETTLTTQEIRK